MSIEQLDALLALQHEHPTGAEAQLPNAPVVDSREFRGGINRIYTICCRAVANSATQTASRPSKPRSVRRRHPARHQRSTPDVRGP